DLPVATRRSQVQAVGAEHHPPDLAVVGAERADLLAVARVPDLHGSVLIARDQVFSIGAERQSGKLRPARRFREREDFALGLGVPDLDGKPRTVAAGGCDSLAVGLPGHAEDNGPVAGELDLALSRLRVQDLDRHAKPGRSNLLAVRADRQAPDLIAVWQ